MVKTLHNYQNSHIALYGLGVETEKFLNMYDGKYSIVGLLDSFQQEGCLFGKQIISLQQCVEKQVKLIIVVARPGSCRAIYKKIASFCIENGIAVFDNRGKDLSVKNTVKYEFPVGVMETKEALIEAANNKDCISFDLFDTLIMRKCLYSSDVLELLEKRLSDMGIVFTNFVGERLKAEKVLSVNKAPSLNAIYEHVLVDKKEMGISAEKLSEIEFQVDKGLLVPRKEMVTLSEKLFDDGKKVYIITDTYYSRSQIEELLSFCGIKKYTDIYVSCEYETGKTQNLFARYLENYVSQRCMHVGDDIVADIECASQYGMESFKISSGLELFEMLGYLGLMEEEASLETRVRLGLFVAKYFNNPFQFEYNGGRIGVDSFYVIGYLFAAPIISDFTLWFSERINKYSIKEVWFGARDGFLIKKLYEILKDADVTYFLTSRTAAIRAGIESKEDIEYVGAMKYSGSLSEQLKHRFGIEVDEREAEGHTLFDFVEVILRRARQLCSNYHKYISTLDISGDNIAFFDFVAKGTTQMYIQRMLSQHMKGLYFLQLEKESMKEKSIDVEAFYSINGTETSTIYEDYYILETILTSPQPSVVEFDETGMPVYDRENRSEEEIRSVMELQQGILDYFKEYIDIVGRMGDNKIDKELDEKILSLIHHVDINCDFTKWTVEDVFFNRMTPVSDLI